MAQLRVDLDTETYQRLLETALSERRPVPWQAEVVLRRALGLPFPYTPHNPRARKPMGANSVRTAAACEEAIDAA